MNEKVQNAIIIAGRWVVSIAFPIIPIANYALETIAMMKDSKIINESGAWYMRVAFAVIDKS